MAALYSRLAHPSVRLSVQSVANLLALAGFGLVRLRQTYAISEAQADVDWRWWRCNCMKRNAFIVEAVGFRRQEGEKYPRERAVFCSIRSLCLARSLLLSLVVGLCKFNSSLSLSRCVMRQLALATSLQLKFPCLPLWLVQVQATSWANFSTMMTAMATTTTMNQETTECQQSDRRCGPTNAQAHKHQRLSCQQAFACSFGQPE